jgi:tocopherol O-methyltransferase
MLEVKTKEAIFKSAQETTYRVARFWNQTSHLWYAIWGPHIHHGFYENTALSPIAAQELLLQKLTANLTLLPNAKLLDVGCGMGGSSIYLAKHFNLDVLGITLSYAQLTMANKFAAEVKPRPKFLLEDALLMQQIPDQSFDIVWSLESCEQFFDKGIFLRQARRVLKPGGQLLLATWCTDREVFYGAQAKHYLKLCKAFDVPYMPSLSWYQNSLNHAGFTIKNSLDWTEAVKFTWEKGLTLLNAYQIWQSLKILKWHTFTAKSKIKLMRDAFATGWMRYGVFIAESNAT